MKFIKNSTAFLVYEIRNCPLVGVYQLNKSTREILRCHVRNPLNDSLLIKSLSAKVLTRSSRKNNKLFDLEIIIYFSSWQTRCVSRDGLLSSKLLSLVKRWFYTMTFDRWQLTRSCLPAGEETIARLQAVRIVESFVGFSVAPSVVFSRMETVTRLDACFPSQFRKVYVRLCRNLTLYFLQLQQVEVADPSRPGPRINERRCF